MNIEHLESQIIKQNKPLTRYSQHTVHKSLIGDFVSHISVEQSARRVGPPSHSLSAGQQVRSHPSPAEVIKVFSVAFNIFTGHAEKL